MYDKAVEVAPQSPLGYRGRAGILLAREEYETALGECQTAIEKDEQDPFSFVVRGDVNLEMERYEQALLDYSRAVKLAPHLPQGYWGRGRVFEIQEGYEEAIAEYSQVIELEPQNSAGYLSRGWAYALLGRYARTYEELDKALALDPSDPQLHTVRGIVHGLEGDSLAALHDFDEAVRLENSAETHVYRGAALLELSGYDDAVAAFDAALSLDPSSQEAWINRAEALRLWGQNLNLPKKFEHALSAVEQALALAPDDAVSHGTRGAILSALGQDEAALQAFDRALHLDPTYGWACKEKGRAQLAHGDAAGALETFQALEQIGPEFVPEAAVGQAMALRALGQPEGEASALHRALGQPPHEAAAYAYRAYLLTEHQAWQDALADFRRATKLDTQLANAHNGIAWYQAEELGVNLVECTTEAELAVEYADDAERGNYLDTLGWVWYKRGDLQVAHAYLLTAVQLAQYDLMIRSHLRAVEADLAQ